jgi:hypothetical protein
LQEPVKRVSFRLRQVAQGGQPAPRGEPLLALSRLALTTAVSRSDADRKVAKKLV